MGPGITGMPWRAVEKGGNSSYELERAPFLAYAGQKFPYGHLQKAVGS